MTSLGIMLFGGIRLVFLEKIGLLQVAEKGVAAPPWIT